MHRLTKAQLKKRKKRRWQHKPIRMKWKVTMKEICNGYATAT